MSAAELATPAAVTRGPSLRFLLSELRLIFRPPAQYRRPRGSGRRADHHRAVAVKYSGDGGGGGEGGFIGQATNNGLFVGLAALTVELPLFLPMAVASFPATRSPARPMSGPCATCWPPRCGGRGCWR